MRKTISILLTCICKLSFSQQLYFNHLSVNNGLSQGVNNCIVKDSKGYIWISSFDGLNRFDGIDCKKFYATTATPQGIKGTLFLNILEDKNGNMWIGSNEGLNFYNRKTDSFNCYKVAATNSTEQFCSPFYIDNTNNIWVQSGTGIFIFDTNKKHFTKYNSIVTGNNIIIKTASTALYQPVKTLLAVSNKTAVIFKGTVTGNKIEWQTFSLPANDITINTMQLNGDNCWLGTSKGLYHCSIENPANCKYINSIKENISSVHIDEAAAIWVGTFNNGLIKANASGEIQQQFISNADNSYSLSGNQVAYIYTDNNRNLWVSVWGKGIDYTNLNKFHFNQHINKTEAVKAGTDNFIRSLIPVNNEVWCATQSGGIIVLDGDKKIKQVIKNNLPPTVEHLCVSDGVVWAATFNGVFQIDAVTKAVTKVNFVSASNQNVTSLQCNFIYRLSNSDLLLSSNAGLFLKRKDKNQLVQLKGVNTADVYLTAFENKDGSLFVSKAFKGFGIYRLSGDSLVSIKQFPLQATIKCFANAKDSVLWIGTTIGLVKFNKTTQSISKIFTTNDGLSNQYIYGIVAHKQFLWISTNAGISRFNSSDNSIKNFSVADGLQSNEYNTYSFCETPGGEILFGGVNGLNSFNPNSLQLFKTSPALVLSNVLVEDSLYQAGVNYDELKRLDVAYKENTVAFQFTVIDYVNAASAHISYMLKGYDKSWVQADNKTFIRYVNLPPGDYTLKVKAFNADGATADKIYELPVSVLPPWWQTWWFRTLAIAGTGAIALLIIKNYLRRKLRKQKIQLEKELAVEQERIRMARELHDGLGSMLSGIKHSFTAIKNEAHLDNAEQQKFEYTIDKLDDSIKDLRAISHTMFSAELLQEGLEAAIKNYCNSVSITSKLPIAFESIYQQPSSLNGEQAFHIFRVVQELIQNIIKHADATEAIVQLSYNSGMLSVTVEDNGAGFDVHKAKHHDGIGLKNVEGRVKLLHGKLDVQSHHGKGTSVFIEVPV